MADYNWQQWQQQKPQAPSAGPKNNEAIVEIRAGAGGDEAGLFGAELFNMYKKYAQSQGWNFSVIDQNISTIGGLKSAVFELKGNSVFTKMKNESGVHRVQRVP